MVHTLDGEFEEEAPILESQEEEISANEEPQGGLEVPSWDLFSQALEPEEEEIELVIVDEVEEEPEAPASIPEVAAEFDAPAPAPMERPQGMVEKHESTTAAFEAPMPEELEEEAPAIATSTFTLDDIEGDGFALDLEEIEAVERPSTPTASIDTPATETSYEAFDLSLSEVPGLKNKAQQDSIENSFQVPAPEFNTPEIDIDEMEDEGPALEFQVRAVEEVKTPVEESLPGVDDMDRPISAVKAANAGDFPKKVKDRISRLQAFQYQFKGANHIDEAERVPAYMRQGLNVDLEHKSEEQPSNIGVDEEGNLRTNNSFLHDNVD